MSSKRTLLVAAAALAASACAAFPPYSRGPVGYGPPVSYGPGPAGYGQARLNVATKAPFGSYLVDASGRALYILEGQRSGAGMHRCMGDCLRVWPALHSSGVPLAGSGLDPRRLSSMPMHGAAHVTYAGWPLYYYYRDRGPGNTTGQHVTDRWGTWHLLSPSGEPIRPMRRY